MVSSDRIDTTRSGTSRHRPQTDSLESDRSTVVEPRRSAHEPHRFAHELRPVRSRPHPSRRNLFGVRRGGSGLLGRRLGGGRSPTGAGFGDGAARCSGRRGPRRAWRRVSRAGRELAEDAQRERRKGGRGQDDDEAGFFEADVTGVRVERGGSVSRSRTQRSNRSRAAATRLLGASGSPVDLGSSVHLCSSVGLGNSSTPAAPDAPIAAASCAHVNRCRAVRTRASSPTTRLANWPR